MTKLFTEAQAFNKFSKLVQDCLKSKICPICNYTLLQQNSTSIDGIIYNFICNEDGFLLSEKYLSFAINDQNYYIEHFGKYTDDDFNSSNPDNIRLKDLIHDLDSVTLLDIYNNLKKFIIFYDNIN